MIDSISYGKSVMFTQSKTVVNYNTALSFIQTLKGGMKLKIKNQSFVNDSRAVPDTLTVRCIAV